MKKILTIALCLAAVGSAGAQMTNVKEAGKIASKDINAARALLKEAMQNPETAQKSDTYYQAGKIEFDYYDKSQGQMAINPEGVDKMEAGNSLLNGYKYYMQALPLDSLPNEKGQVKPANSKKIVNAINGHFNDFYMAGAEFFNNGKYYPEAYESFMIYADMPSWQHASGAVIAQPDSVIGTAYFNAGLAAYSGNALQQSAEAFRRARLNNYPHPESYIYEIACWQNILNNDSTMQDAAKRSIDEVARAGYERFGMEQPIFINNMVNTLVLDDKKDEALALVTKVINENPNTPSLLGLRGFVNDRIGNDEASVADYREAASMPNVDFETLKNASKKIFKVGTQLLAELEGVAPETLAKKKEIRDDYFNQALEIAERARKMNPNDGDLDYVLDSIQYALETYFTGIQ